MRLKLALPGSPCSAVSDAFGHQGFLLTLICVCRPTGWEGHRDDKAEILSVSISRSVTSSNPCNQPNYSQGRRFISPQMLASAHLAVRFATARASKLLLLMQVVGQSQKSASSPESANLIQVHRFNGPPNAKILPADHPFALV